MEWFSFKIYEHDHFYKHYEDYKNGLYMICLNDNIEKWLDENIQTRYDINVDDYYNSRWGSAQKKVDHVIIEFIDREDAMAFKLMWII